LLSWKAEVWPHSHQPFARAVQGHGGLSGGNTPNVNTSILVTLSLLCGLACSHDQYWSTPTHFLCSLSFPITEIVEPE
jgi:hypothetical protein